ncbi:hypothetical protein J2M53_03240 [Arthrobacter sp. zg-ZUI100]|uniref:septum site-determining protein Ssd n=1 Tax=Arthrobacter jiangjiafuii TaxID=2817475 RepID=UPI001AEEA923|nr:septum site-determining protein Ssd [Arthrobacter jiangjiafuii]MBP3035272.1 hypothetical protein [Arthrobacter jiangjiafuii]
MTEEQLWVPAARGSTRTGLLDGPRPQEARPPVVLATSSQLLQDEVARVAAAAGTDLDVHSDLQSALGRDPEVLLLGSDLAGVGPPGSWRQGRAGANGPETILVGTEGNAGLWRDAARLDVARVAVLPAAAGWLAEHLGRRPLPAGFVLGILGGCGGAGASTLACWLADAAAEQGMDTLLMDGDPLGGGLDASLGTADILGVRWPDLVDVRGSLNPLQLVTALPRAGFALLSGGAGDGGQGGTEPGEESTAAVLEAARAGFALTVVDCARHRLHGPLMSSCDALLLVVPGRLRPLLAARTLKEHMGNVPVSAVIRGPLGDGLDETRAAAAVGLSLAGYLPAVPHLEHAEERGMLLERGRRRPIRRVTGALLAQVVPGPAEQANRGGRRT